MKKIYIVSTAVFIWAWLFIFSFAAQGSTVNNNQRETISTIKLTDAHVIKKIDLDKKEEPLIPLADLLNYMNELEEELKEPASAVKNEDVDKIGSLILTEGMGKKRVKLFTGDKKLLGKANKDDKVNVVLFQVVNTKIENDKQPIILQENNYEIGASQLFSAEIDLNRVGVNYLLIGVEDDNQDMIYQLYQIIVEDNKTKDKLESITLQFMK